MASEHFTTRKARYLTLHQRLLVEEDLETREYLQKEADQLEKVDKL
ncbi:hypothetical protein [Spirosoma flavum]|uniref:Uncharacterized protein n=1 Tax=Spirosoma flavum TaxID=2048557 RepID=A0ABW6ASJ0_9BACT